MGANQSIYPSRPPSFNEVPRHVVTSFYPRLNVPEDTVYKPDSVKQGGVGIVFVKAPCVDDQYVADIYVNLLVKGGPAHLSGRIMQGDILRFVDDYDLRHHPTFAFPPLSGPHGSPIVLGFERGFGQPPFYVTLTRSEEFFPDQLALPPPGFEFPSRSARHNPQVSGAEEPGQVSPAEGGFPGAPSDVAFNNYIQNAKAELAQKRRELQERGGSGGELPHHAMGEMQM